MTGNHRDTSITRRRAIAVTGGTVAAGGLAVAGCPSAFADTTTGAEASATASATSTGSGCMTLMTSVTEGPYHLDGALVRKDITAGPLGLRHVQAGARGVLDAGGTATAAGHEALSALDADLHARAWSPRGSAGLLAGALFLDSLPVGTRARPL